MGDFKKKKEKKKGKTMGLFPGIDARQLCTYATNNWQPSNNTITFAAFLSH